MVSDDFSYVGANAALIPESNPMSTWRWYRHVVGPEVGRFVAWLREALTPGVHGKPYAIASQALDLTPKSMR
jgi:hypothetical protein